MMPAISPHSTATSDASWDGPANEGRCPMESGPLRALHAWYSGSNPDQKSSYKFPHHFVSGEGSVGAASTVACSAGIAVLNGGRGGANIGGDRRGVYAHLAKHLRDASKEVPPLRDYSDDDQEARMPPVPMLAHLIERQFTKSYVDVRAADDGKPSHRIGGYAAMYDKPSRPLTGFVEVVARSAFNKSRSDGWPNVICRFNHDSNMLLGTSEARTLTLRSDETGLDYTVDVPENLPLIHEWVRRGDVRKSSFAFRTIQDEWTTIDGDYPLRTLTEVQLVDVAPVVDPAYTSTTAGVRGFIPEEDQARAVVSAGYESLALRVGATVEEVRARALEDRLKEFFVRTDQPTSKPAPKRQTFGPLAKAILESKRPDDR